MTRITSDITSAGNVLATGVVFYPQLCATKGIGICSKVAHILATCVLLAAFPFAFGLSWDEQRWTRLAFNHGTLTNQITKIHHHPNPAVLVGSTYVHCELEFDSLA